VIAWRKSSFSDTASSCVEVRRESDVVYVRDSKLGDHSPIQEWPVEDWLFLTDAIASKQPKFSGYRKLDDGGIRLGWARLGHSPLWFNAGEWLAFEYGVRAGELDPETLSSPVAASRGGEPAAGRPVGSDTADGSGHAAAGAGITGRDTPAPVAAEPIVCMARKFIPAGVHVSPMHLSRNENEHVCGLSGLNYGTHVMQHAGVHRCQCGTSFPAEESFGDLGSLDDDLDLLLHSPAGRSPLTAEVDAIGVAVQPGSDAAGTGASPDLVPAAPGDRHELPGFVGEALDIFRDAYDDHGLYTAATAVARWAYQAGWSDREEWDRAAAPLVSPDGAL
jgi:hypothetical protein